MGVNGVIIGYWKFAGNEFGNLYNAVERFLGKRGYISYNNEPLASRGQAVKGGLMGVLFYLTL